VPNNKVRGWPPQNDITLELVFILSCRQEAFAVNDEEILNQLSGRNGTFNEPTKK
jgi:hypothetical protein